MNLKKNSQWLWLVIFSTSIGVAALFKPIQSIIYIAIAIALIFSIDMTHKNIKKDLKFAAITMLIIILSSSITYNAGIKILENDIEKKVCSTPYKSLAIGLNLYTGTGRFDKEFAKLSNSIYHEAYANGDISSYNDWAINCIKESWQEYPERIVPLFVGKYKNAWGNEGKTYFSWANRAENNSYAAFLSNLYGIGMSAYIDCFAFFLYLLCIFGLMQLKKQKNLFIFFNALFIAGFAAMLLLIEAQVRYKAIIFIPLYFLSIYGMEALHNKYKTPKTKEKLNRNEIKTNKPALSVILLVIYIAANIILVGYHNLNITNTNKDFTIEKNADNTYTITNETGDEGYTYAWYVYDKDNQKIYTEGYTNSPSFTYPLDSEQYVKSFMRDANGNSEKSKIVFIEQ